MISSIPTFPHEINALGDFRVGGQSCVRFCAPMTGLVRQTFMLLTRHLYEIMATQ